MSSLVIKPAGGIGAEFNVACNLADCFGLRTAVATAMVDSPVGDLVRDRVRAAGVTPSYREFAHDGITGPNIATVYTDSGYGVRAPIVFYNRANEAAVQLRPGDFDWDAIFSEHGIRWFRSGGLFEALSDLTPDVLSEATSAARRHGAVVSFDLNYRAKLWKARGGQARAHSDESSGGRAARVLFASRPGRTPDVALADTSDCQLGTLGPAGVRGRGPLDTVFAHRPIHRVE